MTVQFHFIRKVVYERWHKLLYCSLEEMVNRWGASMCSLLHRLFFRLTKKILSTHVGLPIFFPTILFPWNQQGQSQANSFRVPALNPMAAWVGGVEEFKCFCGKKRKWSGLFSRRYSKILHFHVPVEECWSGIKKMWRDWNWTDKHKCQGWFKSTYCHSVRQKFKERKTWSLKRAKKSGEKAREVFRRCCGLSRRDWQMGRLPCLLDH